MRLSIVISNIFYSSPVVKELSDNLYADDWLSGVDSNEEAYALFQEACVTVSQVGMPLKWSSNSRNLINKFNQNFDTQ